MQIWKLLAFLGRYGHQDVTMLLKWQVPDLLALSKSVGDLLKEENEISRLSNDS